MGPERLCRKDKNLIGPDLGMPQEELGVWEGLLQGHVGSGGLEGRGRSIEVGETEMLGVPVTVW